MIKAAASLYARVECVAETTAEIAERTAGLADESDSLGDEQDQSPDLLTTRDAARILNFSDRTVRVWLQDGRLKGTKVGGRVWRVNRASVVRLAGKQAETREPSGELGPHERELFHFGHRLRDRLASPPLRELVGLEKPRPEALWTGEDQEGPVPLDAEDGTVGKEWGFGRYDARGHSLFGFFKQHLGSAHRCWEQLQQVGKADGALRASWNTAFQSLSGKVAERLPDLSREDAHHGLVHSLMVDGLQQGTGRDHGIAFSYDPHSRPLGSKMVWHLRLGLWAVGEADDPAGLTEIVDAHQHLLSAASTRETLSDAVSRWANLGELISDFQSHLGPDPVLRRSVLTGTCDACS